MKRIKSYFSPLFWREQSGGKLLLLASLLFVGCGEMTEETGREATDGELVSVTREVRIHVQAMQSMSNAATRGASDQRTKGGSLHLTYVNDMDTRVQTGTEDLTSAEAKINNAYILQFDGTSAGSVLRTMVSLNAFQLAGNQIIAPVFKMKADVKNRVYVVANVPSTKTLTVNSTTLGDFESPVAYDSNNYEYISNGLPMSAMQDVGSADGFDIFQLRSRFAKLKVTATTGTLQLKGIPNGYTFYTQEGAASPVRLTGALYKTTVTLTSGTTYYVPENLSGQVDLSVPMLRCSLFAPVDAMCLFISANSTTYTLYLGNGSANDFNFSGGHFYNIKVGIYGTDNTFDWRVGVPPSITTLDDSGTANCYIATSTGSWYSFDATVMGNGKSTPLPPNLASNSVAAPIIPSPLNPASADVLWETWNTTSTPAKGSVVRGAYVAKGRILFCTGSSEGNAVIAARDAKNNIVWSWHIWRVNTNPTSSSVPVYTSVNGIFDVTGTNSHPDLTIMNSNLGALNNTNQDNLSIGLLYQWGRKDPFPGGADFANSTTAMATTPSGIPFIGVGNNSRTSQDAVRNPTTFYTSDTADGDWASRNDNLWGTASTDSVRVGTSAWSGLFNSNLGNKSIYDPCPVGWRVPPGYIYAFSYRGGATLFSNGRIYHGVWYPHGGGRGVKGQGITSVGTAASLWTSSLHPHSPARTNYFGFAGGYTNAMYYTSRASGNSLKCVKE